MIQNDQELHTTRDRIVYFEGLLEQMRVRARPEEFPLVASGYRCEIEKMHKEVMDYLTRHASETVKAESA